MNKKPIFDLQLDITYRCNLNCTHCYQDRRNSDHELTLDEWYSALDQFKTLVTQLDVTPSFLISGGEPLLNPDYQNIIETIKYNFKDEVICVLTNGTVISEDDINFFKDNNIHIQLSLDAPKREVHDNIRGAGSFDKVLNSAKKLSANNIPFNFQAVLQNRIKSSIDELFEIAKEYDATAMYFTRLIPSYNKINDCLKGENLRDAYIEILRCGKKYNVETNTNQPLWCLIDENLGHPHSAGFLGLTINPSGEIYPTSRVHFSIGNIKNKNGMYIAYFKNPIMKSLRNGEIEGCSKCKYFIKCRGDRNISYVIYNTFLAQDEHCWYYREKQR